MGCSQSTPAAAEKAVNNKTNNHGGGGAATAAIGDSGTDRAGGRTSSSSSPPSSYPPQQQYNHHQQHHQAQQPQVPQQQYQQQHQQPQRHHSRSPPPPPQNRHQQHQQQPNSPVRENNPLFNKQHEYQQHQLQEQQRQQRQTRNHQNNNNNNYKHNHDHHRFSANGRNGYVFTQIYRKTADTQLDKGNFGFIYKCENLLLPATSPYKLGAVKVCKPNDLDKMAGPMKTYDQVEARCQEIHTLVLLNSQPLDDNSSDEDDDDNHNILKLYEYFYQPKTMELHVVTELLGMNLRDWLVQRDQFTEDEGRQVATVVLKAIRFMHQRNVMHRDIKEANVVFRQNGKLDSLVIVDFGLAKELKPEQKEKVFCGSLGYIAPEIYMQEQYSYEVDLFSFGVLLFKILSGKRPWPSGPPDETRRRTENLEYRIVNEQWQGVSPYGQDLIRKLLVFREERLNVDEALDHDWVNEHTGTVLRIQSASSYRRPSEELSPSDAVILQHETRHADSREGATFWIEENVQNALMDFVAVGAYHGNVLDHKNGHALVEETSPGNAILLPHYVMSLNRYTERECRYLSRAIANRILLFHESNVVHRKLHLENVLVQSHMGRPDFNLSLRGVQYAQMIRKDIPLTGRVGRRNQFRSWHAFIAPEIETKFYHDEKVDLWSLGAIMYTLLCGIAPVKGAPLFEVVLPSQNAQDLVKRLLQIDPNRRMNIKDVMRHPWMSEADEVLAQHDLELTKMIFGDYLNAGR